MVHINMNAGVPARELSPGVHLWRIEKVVDRESKSGNMMLDLTLTRQDASGTQYLHDFILLEGGGWAWGQRKLKAIIASDFDGDLDTSTLIDTELWVATKVEEYMGKDSLKVDQDQLEHAGYQHADNVPDGCEAPSQAPF